MAYICSYHIHHGFSLTDWPLFCFSMLFKENMLYGRLYRKSWLWKKKEKVKNDHMKHTAERKMMIWAIKFYFITFSRCWHCWNSYFTNTKLLILVNFFPNFMDFFEKKKMFLHFPRIQDFCWFPRATKKPIPYPYCKCLHMYHHPL